MNGRWMREDFTNWKKSTSPSDFTRSSWAWMQRNVPVRPMPSLQETNGIIPLYLLKNDTPQLHTRTIQYTKVPTIPHSLWCTIPKQWRHLATLYNKCCKRSQLQNLMKQEDTCVPHLKIALHDFNDWCYITAKINIDMPTASVQKASDYKQVAWSQWCLP